VPGDDIIFDDNLEKETLGEFPSQWDLYAGSAEVASANGKKAIEMANTGDVVGPLMKNAKNYLGDVFTIEYDMLLTQTNNTLAEALPVLSFWKANTKGNTDTYGFDKDNELMSFKKTMANDRDHVINYTWISSSGVNDGTVKLDGFSTNTWHHIAVSFNKRAWKVYLDGVRLINVPNVSTPPGWFEMRLTHWGNDVQGKALTTNWRIAKGAVPLYDRLQSEGKIVTYGITFDVGKSTIKPESMTEINRIAQLMKDNPDVKFSVEGHTDNTGNAASNQTLSEARSKAVVDKLVEMGISQDRLKSEGKGQTSPIADNSTEEGRAKNRRVEFVKIN
jgi:outer membrane protein OmpA-like peptidoglycan-associated protein